MNSIKIIGYLISSLAALTACSGQNPNLNKNSRVGGDCEAGWCDLIYLGMPKDINSVDTSAGWFEKGRKLLIKGTVFKVDGRTPASNVIVYYHQTDNDGYYSPRNDKPENQTRHGHIRGWVKTDNNGKYSLYTIRPAHYPGEQLPEHIHIIIKEPNIGNEYWINDINFEDDPLLLPYIQKHPYDSPRGGSGVVRIRMEDSVQVADHKIILGLNIPNYPR